LDRGSITDAIKKFERVLKYDPDKCLELKPDLSCAWVNKAQLLLSSGKKDEALRCYDEALKYDDKSN
jgi:tetratricopeptide (TPR) repeat protein